MTDLEITKLCAEVMGVPIIQKGADAKLPFWYSDLTKKKTRLLAYNPLHNDAQAMALVKKLHLHIDQRPGKACSAQDPHFTVIAERSDCDLNRAICECVAKMQASKEKAHVQP